MKPYKYTGTIPIELHRSIVFVRTDKEKGRRVDPGDILSLESPMGMSYWREFIAKGDAKQATKQSSKGSKGKG